MSDPVLLTASYQSKQHTNAYGAVVWDALVNPPESGVEAYNSVVDRAHSRAVQSYDNLEDFPGTGEINKVYLARDTGLHYYWLPAPNNAYILLDTRSKYTSGSRHGDWLRDFYDSTSIYVPAD